MTVLPHCQLSICQLLRFTFARSN